MPKPYPSSICGPRVLEKFENFLFIVPAVAIFAVFYIYPFFDIFHLSLQEWNGISLHRDFVGLMNFRDLLDDKSWWNSIGNAAFITLIALTFQNAAAFGLALACDRDIKMKQFYRVVFFIPPVLSEVVVGLIWQWILYAGAQDGQQIGLLNYTLVKTGLPHLVNDWLSDPGTALTCIAVVHSWKGFGWGFVMLLAGLQMIDKELYEAARVDGAGPWGVFWNVTVPNMLPMIVVVMILTILGSMQVFVLILSMAGQGLVDYTSVPVTRILESMTSTNRFGYACAQGVVFGLILVSVSFALKKLSDRMKV
ncbi:MAG: sugar ABC transporter permease [Candidatus Omnitrophota bacterium]|nr:sugar ABC transporter permease [Candidatus Omnitrophota bacterium]MDZ4243265.1 sugar ABC transporter permease [Candidatus Omnitrophota bacterium]